MIIGEQRGEAVRYTLCENTADKSDLGLDARTLDLLPVAEWGADAFGTPKQMTMLSKCSAM